MATEIMKIITETIIEKISVKKEYKFEEGYTSLGYTLVTFKDQDATNCCIQESSMAETPHIWLGVNCNRMHLNQTQAKAISEYLSHFIESGLLSPLNSVDFDYRDKEEKPIGAQDYENLP